MKKTLLFISIIFTFLLFATAQDRPINLPVDKSIKHKVKTFSCDTVTLAKADSSLVSIEKINVEKANTVIDMSSTDSVTKEQLKSIVGDVPEVANSAQEIVKIMESKDQTSSDLQYYIYLIGAIITFLTFLAGLVKKIRALPYYFSPIYWFEKITGKNKASLNGIKGTYKHVFVPDGSEAKTEPISSNEVV